MVKDKTTLLDKISNNTSNAKMSDVIKLLELLGFEKIKRKKSGSHINKYKHPKFPQFFINLQSDKKDKKLAKKYQVEQVLDYIKEMEK